MSQPLVRQINAAFRRRNLTLQKDAAEVSPLLEMCLRSMFPLNLEFLVWWGVDAGLMVLTTPFRVGILLEIGGFGADVDAVPLCSHWR